MISHQHKCLFIHIPKVAGQSIEMFFLNLLGLTWETRAPLLLRKNDCQKIGPPRLAHLSIEEYLQYNYLSKELFDNYFKFSFVRNPWDRVVSMYYYYGYDQKYEFQDFIIKHFKKVFDSNYWFMKPQIKYIINHKFEVDFIGRFENLQSDFEFVCKQLNINNLQLIHKNKSTRLLPHYREYYDNNSQQIIYDIYKEDIKQFNYKF